MYKSKAETANIKMYSHMYFKQEQLEGTQWHDNAGTASPPLQGWELAEFQVADASMRRNKSGNHASEAP